MNRMASLGFTVLLIATITGNLWGQTAQTGGISGTVTNTKGRGIAATVEISRFGAVAPVVQVKSEADGTFAVSGLAAGAYRTCATAKVPGYLDSCLWRRGGPVLIMAGKRVTGRKVVLENSRTLQVRIDDPSGVLTASASGKTDKNAAQPGVLAGVYTDERIFVSMAVKGNSGGRDHEVEIPEDRPVAMRVLAKSLVVGTADKPDADVSGKDIPVKLEAGKTSAPILFRVKGAGK